MDRHKNLLYQQERDAHKALEPLRNQWDEAIQKATADCYSSDSPTIKAMEALRDRISEVQFQLGRLNYQCRHRHADNSLAVKQEWGFYASQDGGEAGLICEICSQRWDPR